MYDEVRLRLTDCPEPVYSLHALPVAALPLDAEQGLLRLPRSRRLEEKLRDAKIHFSHRSMSRYPKEKMNVTTFSIEN